MSSSIFSFSSLLPKHQPPAKAPERLLIRFPQPPPLHITRNPEPGRFSFRVFRIFRGYHSGCGFAALRSSRLCGFITAPNPTRLKALPVEPAEAFASPRTPPPRSPPPRPNKA